MAERRDRSRDLSRSALDVQAGICPRQGVIVVGAQSAPTVRSTGNAAISTSRHLESDQPLLDRLKLLAAEVGGPLPAIQAEKLVALASLVARWGARMNLTGHGDAEAILEHLVLDALALRAQIRQLVPASSGQRIVDLGSGAGFPGLPLAIVEPESQIELVEARRRRHHFQRTARRELELGNVEPRLGRIEDLEPTRADIVVAQALARIDQVVGWGTAWTRSGGLLIVPGSERPPVAGPHSAVVASGTRHYETPAGRARSLWWGRIEGPVPPAT